MIDNIEEGFYTSYGYVASVNGSIMEFATDEEFYEYITEEE